MPEVYNFNDHFLDTEKINENWFKPMQKEFESLKESMKPHFKKKEWFTLDFEPTNNQLVFLAQYSELRNSFDSITNKITIECKLK